MAPRLIACDYDGTVTDAGGRLQPGFPAAVARAAAAGVAVVMATGRCLGGLPGLLERLPLAAPVVAGNGALVVDPPTRRVLAQWPIRAALLAEHTRRLRAELPQLRFGVERGPVFLHEAGYPPPAHGRRPIRTVSWEELVAEDAAKLAVRWPVGPDGASRAADPGAVQAVVGGDLVATHSGVPGLVEVSAAGVTKATGLAWVAHRLGVAPADVVAYGDMPNDRTMLRWSGRPVAVPWADPGLLAEVRERTPAWADGGVAAHLTALLAGSGTGRAAAN